MRPGDWVQVRTPGGGGYGDPVEAIAWDLARGYMTEEQAAAHYGEQ